MNIVNKTKTLCKISLVSIALVLLLVSTALAATESDTGNVTIKDNNVSSATLSTNDNYVGNVTIKDDYISSTASAATAESASPKITETQISASGSASFPDIYGDKIVWTDSRNGSDIYMYDLSTKKETQITTNESTQHDPAIYGNRIIWEDYSNDYLSNNIYMYDLSTKKETQIPTNNELEWEWPVDSAIYGDKIVWAYSFEEYSEIYMYDLSTSKETQITTTGRAYNPAIYGNRIVWQDDRDGNYDYDIYMYDISTKKETQITTSGSVEVPAIYGDRIVYADNRNGNYDIYMYDISTKKETQITSSPDAQTSPAIYGDRIVWEDDGGNDDGGTNHGIYMYDISTNQKMEISAKGSAYYPAIYGNNIVWQYGFYGNSDIYMGTLSNAEPKLPIAAFSAKPTSGKVPLKVQFTDKSTGTPTTWKWNFGDGKYSTEKNPAHTYSKAGKYTVALTVKNAAGSNTLKRSGYINVAAPLKAPIAAFSASPRSGKAPLKVQFTDKSSNSPTSWKWSFGDGTYSTAKNPVHKYSKAGKYAVKLTVKNAKGNDTKAVSSYITVKK
jgi:beta propeller repeat protein